MTTSDHRLAFPDLTFRWLIVRCLYEPVDEDEDEDERALLDRLVAHSGYRRSLVIQPARPVAAHGPYLFEQIDSEAFERVEPSKAAQATLDFTKVVEDAATTPAPAWWLMHAAVRDGLMGRFARFPEAWRLRELERLDDWSRVGWEAFSEYVFVDRASGLIGLVITGFD